MPDAFDNADKTSIMLRYSPLLIESIRIVYTRPHVAMLSARIAALYHQLDRLPSLEPDDQVNRLFSEFVAVVLSTPDEVATAVLDHPQITAIRTNLLHLCSTGEYKLEHHWSWRVICSDHPHSELRRFPYYQNYEQLTSLEYAAIRTLRRHPIARVLFIGAGPLPLTALLLAQQASLVVDTLDNCREACRLARQLVNRLDLAALVRVYHGDATDYCLSETYDLVIVAALAGLDRSAKARILAQLAGQVPAGQLLIVRTAQHLRQLLYPQVYSEDLVGFLPRRVLHPGNNILNSILIAEKS